MSDEQGRPEQRRPRLGLSPPSAERFCDSGVIQRLETWSRIVDLGIKNI